MKLTKGKIIKLYKTNKQTRKQHNQHRQSKHKKSFRRNKKINLERKTLKRYPYNKHYKKQYKGGGDQTNTTLSTTSPTLITDISGNNINKNDINNDNTNNGNVNNDTPKPILNHIETTDTKDPSIPKQSIPSDTPCIDNHPQNPFLAMNEALKKMTPPPQEPTNRPPKVLSNYVTSFQNQLMKKGKPKNKTKKHVRFHLPERQ